MIFRVRHKENEYFVNAKDNISAVRKIKDMVVNDSSIEDEHLSPMTYKKLKEIGYTKNQWQHLSQEQANIIVEKHNKGEEHEFKKQMPQNKTTKYSQFSNIIPPVVWERLVRYYGNDTSKVKGMKPEQAKRKLASIEKEKGIVNLKNGSSKYPETKRYGSNKKLDKLVDSEDINDRIEAAKQGYGLDKLVDDEEDEVRETVARMGYGLDKLINDEDWFVRREVAYRGYGLDKLVNDKNAVVREAVAYCGYGLDKLINDKDEDVRRAVAENYYGLEKLVHDKSSRVREFCLEIGYRPDLLIKDPDPVIRETIAQHYVKQFERQGYDITPLIDDPSEDVRDMMAQQGYALDKYVNDKSYLVRMTVARKGYGLDKLKDDPDEDVRELARYMIKEQNSNKRSKK